MKKYFRIALKGSHPVIFFDLEVPEGQSLPVWWMNVTLAGSVVTENFCVTYDQIAHVSVVMVDPGKPQGFTPRVVN